MAAGDTAHWLQNKLGPTDDLWSGRTICAQLNVDRLQSIQECFPSLLPHVKVKLLLSFLHLNRRNIEQWQDDLNIIVQMAINDSDNWVNMVAEIVKDFPETGALNLHLQNSSGTFAEILSDLKKSVRKANEVRMLPLECQYLNRQALNQTAGQIAPLTRHFQIKRKPKSATLRAEIVTKSNEAANNKKNNVPNSVPIKSRSFLKKMDTTTPMKGIPSRAPPSSKFRSLASSSKLTGPSVTVTPLGNTWVTNKPRVNSKEGGVKFLEIEEQPVGAREAKKRKRQADMEAMEVQKKAKEEAVAAAATTSNTAPQPFTPDYAAGLMAPATPKMPSAILSTTATLTVQGPTYVPSTARIQPAANAGGTTTLSGVGVLSAQQPARKTLTTTTVIRPAIALATTTTNTAAAATTIAGQATVAVGTAVAPSNSVAVATSATAVTGSVSVGQAATIIVQASPQLLQQAAGQKLVAAQVRLPAGVQVQGQAGTQAVQVRLAAPPVVTTAAAAQQQSVQPAQQISQSAQQPKKGLSLTRDQMMEAQEMFRVSNKVTRPEKALILGFMAGSRDNPCPQQGNVLNIKLSENEETVAQVDGSQKKVVVDTYFQMNYGSGEWKRFRKYRDMVAS